MPEGRVTTRQRRTVTTRARDCCEYCRSQARFAMQSLSVEHIVPRARGGNTTTDNLALSCQGCNGHKYTKTEGRDPLTGVIVPLYHPRRQRWRDHFDWDAEAAHIVGLTPEGRATVVALHLNRECLVNLRQVLYAMGKHPPRE